MSVNILPGEQSPGFFIPVQIAGEEVQIPSSWLPQPKVKKQKTKEDSSVIKLIQKISSPEVEAYEPLVRNISREYARPQWDVLLDKEEIQQEARLAVFLALRTGHKPSKKFVRNHVISYRRSLRTSKADALQE